MLYPTQKTTTGILPTRLAFEKTTIKGIKNKITELNQVINKDKKKILNWLTGKKDGYIAGTTAIELQSPKGMFREGQDIDLYFKDIDNAKLEQYANELLKILGENYYLDKAQSHIKIKNKKTGLDIADLGIRGNKTPDKIIEINGLRMRKANQIIADKKDILKHVDKTEAKYQKAKKDLELWKEAEEKLIQGKETEPIVMSGVKGENIQ